jgi:D-alanyl-D-alanine carboxypeptidase
MGASDRFAFYALLILGIVGFQAYQAGAFGTWLRAKAWNTAEPAPAGKGLGHALSNAAARVGTPMTSDQDKGANNVVAVAGISGGLDAAIAPRVEQMIADAAKAGIALTGGGYRSAARQIELRKAHCGTSHYDIYDKPSTECKPPTARPGSSQHERGRAIDFEFCDVGTPVWTWLTANASRYGLYNWPVEAWHWSTTGT